MPFDIFESHKLLMIVDMKENNKFDYLTAVINQCYLRINEKFNFYF